MNPTASSINHMSKSASNRSNFHHGASGEDEQDMNRSEAFNSFLGSLRGEDKIDRRERSGSLKKGLESRPSVQSLVQKNIIPGESVFNKDVRLHLSKSAFEKKKKQDELNNRLARRPERWDMYKRDILLTESGKTTPRDQHLNHEVKTGIMMRGGIGQQEASASISFAMSLRSDNVDHHESHIDAAHVRRRLSNHFQTRPKFDKLVESNLVPAAYDNSTGAEFYVFRSGDMMDVDTFKFQKRQKELEKRLGNSKHPPKWKQDMSS